MSELLTEPAQAPYSAISTAAAAAAAFAARHIDALAQRQRNTHATFAAHLRLAEQADLGVRRGQRRFEVAEGHLVRVAVGKDDGRRRRPELADGGNRQP